MEVTQVTVRKQFIEGPLKLIMSVTFDNEFVVHDVKIVEKDDKILVVMPNKKSPTGQYSDIVHPINAEARAKLEAQIFKLLPVQNLTNQQNS